MTPDLLRRCAALALLVPVAACGGAATSAPPTSPPAAPEPTVPTAPSAVGSVVQDTLLPPGALTGVRTGSEGRELVFFFVGAAEYVDGEPCTARYAAEVAETVDEVRVGIRSDQPPSPEPVACPLVGFPRSLAVELAEPLGGRTLVALGQQQAVFDGATLAEPGWTPDGWSVAFESPGLMDVGVSSWTRAWTPQVPDDAGACPPGSSGLALLEGEPDAVDRSFVTDGVEAVATHDVNGATATEWYQANRDLTRLVWTAGDRRYAITAAPACEGDAPTSLDVVLQFARGLDTSSAR